MLREIKQSRQNEGEPLRKIFNGEQLSLILWYEEDFIVSFQINYQQEGDTLSFNWDLEKGYLHRKVDNGERRPFRHKMSSLLSVEKPYDKQRLLKMFIEQSDGLKETEKLLIKEKLK